MTLEGRIVSLYRLTLWLDMFCPSIRTTYETEHGRAIENDKYTYKTECKLINWMSIYRWIFIMDVIIWRWEIYIHTYIHYKYFFTQEVAPLFTSCECNSITTLVDSWVFMCSLFSFMTTHVSNECTAVGNVRCYTCWSVFIDMDSLSFCYRMTIRT